jgi:hypothetical protein
LSFRRNRTFLAAWLTPLLIALLALALPATGAAAETGSIAGTVTAEGGGVLSGIEVCAEEVEEEDFGCTKTGSGGTYQLNGLDAGEYKVAFVPAENVNYLWQYYEGVRSWEAATPVEVTAGTVKSGVDAVLEKGATISGTVTAAATGLPVREVLVCAWATDESSFNCAETSAAGSYTIVGLTGGQFELEFFPEGTGQGLLYQTYSLGLVTVAAHGEAKGVNQALQPGGQVTGVVRLAATGAPLAGVRVCLTRAATVEQPLCLTSPASGAFRFYGLPRDSYKVVFSPAANEVPDEAPIVDTYPTQWWQGASSFATATPIVVTPPGIVSGIDGALGPPPAAVVTPPVVAPTTPPTVKKVTTTEPRLLKCRHGFAKRKVHGKAKCVRVHKAAKHKRRHKKSA